LALESQLLARTLPERKRQWKEHPRICNERQRAECHLGAPKPANDQQVCPVVVHARNR
jgi:hypothetical protein